MCDSPGDRPCNSGFVKGWRLVAKGVLPGSLRRFRLAALRLRQVLKLQVPDKCELLYAVMLYLD